MFILSLAKQTLRNLNTQSELKIQLGTRIVISPSGDTYEFSTQQLAEKALLKISKAIADGQNLVVVNGDQIEFGTEMTGSEKEQERAVIVHEVGKVDIKAEAKEEKPANEAKPEFPQFPPVVEANSAPAKTTSKKK